VRSIELLIDDAIGDLWAIAAATMLCPRCCASPTGTSANAIGPTRGMITNFRSYVKSYKACRSISIIPVEFRDEPCPVRRHRGRNS